MGIKTDYVEAIKRLDEIMEDIFNKMSGSCKYCEQYPGGSPLGPTYNTCLYYGRKGGKRCEMEACPLFEEEG